MAHTHNDLTMDSTLKTHKHGGPTINLEDCGRGYTSHDHTSDDGYGGSHRHSSMTVHFASASLGSPNWWEHKHIITADIPSAGPSHSHAVVSPTGGGFCGAPTPSPGCYTDHTHTCALSEDATAFSHTHSVSLAYNLTDNADQSGTPANHTHTFKFITTDNGSHVHVVSGTINNNTCVLGYNHNHTAATPCLSVTHSHSNNTGTTPAGGEGAAVPKIQIDGFVTIIS